MTSRWIVLFFGTDEMDNPHHDHADDREGYEQRNCER
jgi:hypothetical protein